MRPRIALVGPLPPSPSGVGTYNGRLVEALAARCDLDCYVDGPALDQQTRHDPVHYLPPYALGRVIPAGAYDGVIHVLGNSIFHADAWESLLRNGGTAWLHDANLAGMYLPIAGRLGDHNRAAKFMGERLVASYGTRVPWDLIGSHTLDYQRYVDLGLLMTGEVLEAASELIVSSDLARSLCAADAGRKADGLRATVLPLAFPSVAALARQNPNVIDRVRPLLVSCGWLSRVKQPDLILRAVALLPRALQPFVAFVGQVDEVGLDGELLEFADSLGLSDLVMITGRVTDTEYWDWLGAASCAVQLRARTSGESSAVISEAMAAGVAVITNLPGDAAPPAGSVINVAPMFAAEALASTLTEVFDDVVWRHEVAATARKVAAELELRRLGDGSRRARPLGSVDANDDHLVGPTC